MTPGSVIFQALNPTTAQNISNYSLINTSQNDEDESKYVATANFVAAAPTLDSTNTYVLAYNGQINLTFLPGLPAGIYTFVAHTTELQYPGLTDAAGNPLDDTNVPGEGTKDFIINFDVQPSPVYITSMALESSYNSNGSTVIGTEQSYFELPPGGGTNTRDNVPAPPTAIAVDFSNPLPYATAGGTPINYTNDLELIASANNANSAPDGDFGNLGEAGLGSSGTGFTVLSNYTVSLYNFNVTTQTWSLVTTPGESGTQLVLQLKAGSTLPADDYRIYMPNQGNATGVGTGVFDVYGNQLDGENLGNQTSQTSPEFNNPDAPVIVPNYEDLQSSGANRQNDLSGDGVAGGAFMSAFTVVNYGNVVYARPDYVENPLEPSTLSNGTLAQPYPVLAPEGDPSTAPANPNHSISGGLNSTTFFQPGNFNTSYDFSGDGKYEQSALYAASQLSYDTGLPEYPGGPTQLGGPVIVVAEPGVPQRNPITGAITQATFVLQAPAGNNSGVTNGSASVPFDTTLVFAAGSTLKLQNAALYVQNQGSAIQALGTTSDPVNFTSYNDATIGGATNNNPDTTPHGGDWGGIVFRNYNQSANPTATFPVDGSLVGLNGGDAVSGAADAMSIMNNFNIRYGGGAVPQGSSDFLSSISLFNARPSITNGNISDGGGTGGTEGAIGADMDSFREDDTARGPLIRQISVTDNTLNGLYLMAEANGFIEPTNAIAYPNNPSTLGGTQNYTFFEPLPFVVLAQLIVGQEFEVNTGGLTEFVKNRLYIQPGVMMKFGGGSALDVLTAGSSLNVGSRSYINGFDQNNDYNPLSPGFTEESASDPNVLFTSLYDDLATTTLVPNPINVTGETAAESAAKLVPAAWGSVGIESGGIAVINAATFQYGGGQVNTQNFTIPSQSVLAFVLDDTDFNTDGSDAGSYVYITNNNFYHNFDAAMQIEPNGLLAGNPLTPLASGNPFLRGNVMTNNGIDGLMVLTNQLYLYTANYSSYLGPEQAISPSAAYNNLSVNSVWDLTDITYVLKGTLIISVRTVEDRAVCSQHRSRRLHIRRHRRRLFHSPFRRPCPEPCSRTARRFPARGNRSLSSCTTTTRPTTRPLIWRRTSTGQREFLPLKGRSRLRPRRGRLASTPPLRCRTSPMSSQAPTPQLRILGIPGNQTTGQQRVPVIITSLRDGTVGTTVRGVVMDDIWNSAPVQVYQAAQAGTTFSTTTPEAGDGGYIYIGAEVTERL